MKIRSIPSFIFTSIVVNSCGAGIRSHGCAQTHDLPSDSPPKVPPRIPPTPAVPSRQGLIVTSASLLPLEEQAVVMRMPRPDGGVMELPASIVSVDRGRNLIFLRPPRPMNVSPLALRENARIGETVAMLSHPAIGGQILYHTLTEGVISHTFDPAGCHRLIYTRRR